MSTTFRSNNYPQYQLFQLQGTSDQSPTCLQKTSLRSTSSSHNNNRYSSTNHFDKYYLLLHQLHLPPGCPLQDQPSTTSVPSTQSTAAEEINQQTLGTTATSSTSTSSIAHTFGIYPEDFCVAGESYMMSEPLRRLRLRTSQTTYLVDLATNNLPFPQQPINVFASTATKTFC